MAEVILDVSKKRSKVVWVIPAPTGQILEVVFIDKLESIDIIGEDIPELLSLRIGIDFEIVSIVV